MQKTDLKKGMKCVMSRGGNGAKVTVKVDRVNTKTASVTTLEPFNSKPKGTQYRAPFVLLEPLPESGNKDEVEIKSARQRRQSNASIVVGTTTFRSVYADSNALWKVVRKEGRNYRCEIQNEPIEIDGKTYDGDYTGQQKIFSPEEIQGSIGMSKMFDGLSNQHDAFYASLVPGQTIHYQNGFNNWVRCEVVVEDGENKLKPIALVGEWGSHDLPRRRPNGEIYNGYHADKILKGETFNPNASNLFENGCKPRNGGADPTTLSPISLAVPDMTPDEEATAVLWQKVEAIAELTGRDTHDKNPADILDGVSKLLK